MIWLVVAVPLSLVLLATYYEWYSARVSLVQQDRQGYAENAAASFQLLLSDMRFSLRSSGEVVADSGASAQGSATELRRLAVLYPAAYVAFADDSGRILSATEPGLVGSSVSTDVAFQASMRRTDGSGIEPSHVSSGGVVGFHVAQVIPSRQGRASGVMMMLVDVRRLSRSFPVMVPSGGVSVVDSAGQVVFQNEDLRFAEERARWGDEFPFVRRALRGRIGVIRDWRFPLGGTRIGVFVPIPGGWAAGSSVSPAVALAPFYQTLSVGLPVALGMAALALLVGIAISRDIHRSVDRLAEDALRIGSGELDDPVAVDREDEIGEVAKSLESARVELQEARERASRELETTSLLLRTSQALAKRGDLEEVLDRLAGVLLEATPHSRSFVFFWDERRRALMNAASAGARSFPRGTVFSFDSLGAAAHSALLDKRTVVGDFEASAMPQRGWTLAEERSHLAAIVPLVAHEDLVGVLGVDDPGERREFDEREIEIVEAIAAQAAVAFENARLFDEQARARELADKLDEINRVIHSSLEFRQTMQQALELAGGALGAGAGAVFLGEGGVAAAGFQYGFPEGFLGTRYAAEVFPFAKLMVATQEPVAVGEHQLGELMNADIAREFGIRSLVAIPLAGRERVIGGIGLVFAEAHESSPVELDFARKLGASVSLAIENARLYEAEREIARFGRSMAAINADLASSLDIDETLPVVLERLSQEIGARGAAITDLVEGGWRIRQLVGVGAPGFSVGSVFPREQTPALERVMRTRQPYVVPDVRTAADVNEQNAEWIGYRAFAAYPLIVRGELTGTLMVYFDAPRELSDQDLDYLRRVAFAVSVTEENSRLYKAEHRIAETLQTALLALPERIPGIEFAHLYHSATEAARVGGDFYDLFELEHDMVGITVGDISGHGVDAAVLTSLVKNAIRVQATQQDRRPDSVMATASRLLYDNSPTEIFATVFFGVLHLDDGLLEYCNAGHTTGATICSDGGVRKLRGNSPLIGAFAREEFALSTYRLAAGDLLFLYTDGLTEARRDHELYGEERLFELLARERGDPDTTLRRVIDEVLAFAGGRLSDDLAILAVRLGQTR